MGSKETPPQSKNMNRIYKHKPKSYFTTIANELIRDSLVSDAAFKLIVWIQSHSDDFSICFAGIKKALGWGKDKLQAALKNAEANEYLVRTKKNNPSSGLFEYEYYVFATKQDCRDFLIQESPAMARPVAGEPVPGYPVLADTAHIKNTKYKEEQNKNSPLTPQGEEGEGDGIREIKKDHPSPQLTRYEETKPEKSSFGQKNPAFREVIPPRVPAEVLKNQVEIDDLGEETDPFLIGRQENPIKKSYKSKASDPWMRSQNNVDQDFAQWRYKNFYEPNGKSLADAKAEIRNDCIKARDLWEEYQSQEQEKRDREEQSAAMRGENEQVASRKSQAVSDEEAPYILPKTKWPCWTAHMKTWTEDELENYSYMDDEQKEFMAEIYCKKWKEDLLKRTGGRLLG